jgi:DNA polymerase delta subunit 1
MSQLLRKTRDRGLVLPAIYVDSCEDKFEGATVIEPKKGFYAEPVATLDFASLYPSIMMAHNLCYTTLVAPSERGSFEPGQLTTTPSGDTFVKPEVRRGVLPEILEELLAAR